MKNIHLPSLDFDIGDGVKVSREVVLIHHCGSSRGSKEADPQVGDGEEVPQVFGRVQLTVQGGHVVQPRSSEKREAIFDLKAHRFVVLPHVTA